MNQSNRDNNGERKALATRGRIPMASFNDDDIYVYDTATLQLHRTIGCNSMEGFQAYHQGIRVSQNQSWAKGLSAKYRGLWRLSPSELTPKGQL